MLPGLPGSMGVKGDCLKPNDYGLFDMLGNALEWCQDSAAYYRPEKDEKASEDIEDKKDIKEIKDKLSRVLRGGSFGDQASDVRSAYRNGYAPANRVVNVGVRPARTFR
jgi:formylglycine-generating enzyme required for sulfatase activity